MYLSGMTSAASIKTYDEIYNLGLSGTLWLHDKVVHLVVLKSYFKLALIDIISPIYLDLSRIRRTSIVECYKITGFKRLALMSII